MVSMKSMVVSTSALIAEDYWSDRAKYRYTITFVEKEGDEQTGRFLEVSVPEYSVKASHGFEPGEAIELLHYSWNQRNTLRRKAETKGLLVKRCKF